MVGAKVAAPHRPAIAYVGDSAWGISFNELLTCARERIGVTVCLFNNPMAAYVFGGVTGSGTDLLVAAFRASGANIVASVMAQGAVSDPFDKMLSFMIVWLILRSMPERLKAR